MQQLNRREFLNKSLVTAGTMASWLSTPHRVLGANERVNMALVGCGGRGRYVTRGMAELGAEVTYLCDVHQGQIDKVASLLAQVQQRKPKAIKSMQQICDDKDVDAVIIASPDHWHAAQSILACQAGKDVYVEKPHSHNIWESRRMIEAAEKYNRIVQIGTQSRSAAYVQAAVEYIKSGKIGDIHLVKVYNLKSGKAFHLGQPGKPDDGMDWNQWLGAAPYRPYHQGIFQNNGWYKFWDYGCGDMGDDGIHQLDLAMMLMGNPGMPKSVSCDGGRIHHKGDDGEIPDVQILSFDFDNFVMTFELTGYPPYMRKTTGTIRRSDKFPYWMKNATRVELYGSKYMMTIGRLGGGWQVTTTQGRIVDQMYGRFPDTEHEQNFIDCLKSRNTPTADINTLDASCNMVHMSNIAHRVGNQKLWFDSKNEQFIDNDKANALLKRKYRKGYEVPDKV